MDGVAIGSSLAPGLANIFMDLHESKWLDEYNLNKPKFYLRYVDDILAAFDNKQDSLKSHTLIISQIDLYRPSLKI